jgi:hypothetical protein
VRDDTQVAGSVGANAIAKQAAAELASAQNAEEANRIVREAFEADERAKADAAEATKRAEEEAALKAANPNLAPGPDAPTVIINN